MTPHRAVDKPFLHSEQLGCRVAALLGGGPERRDLGGLGGVLAALGRRALDLGAAAAEGAQHGLRDPLDLSGAVVDLSPLDAEAAGELEPQLGLVEVAAGFGVRVQATPVERR